MVATRPSATCQVVSERKLVVGSEEVFVGFARCGERRATFVAIPLSNCLNASLYLWRANRGLVAIAKLEGGCRYFYGVCWTRIQFVNSSVARIEVLVARSTAPLRTMLLTDKYVVTVVVELGKEVVIKGINVRNYIEFSNGCSQTAFARASYHR